MRRQPQDDEEDSVDELFRRVERWMEGIAQSMDRMLGPYGHVEVDMDHQFITPRGDRPGTSSETPVDVQADTEALRVVADLRGVSKDGLEITCDGRTLSITGEGDRRTYDERIRLPVRVDARAATASYNNGILEVTLPRHATDSGTALEIE